MSGCRAWNRGNRLTSHVSAKVVSVLTESAAAPCAEVTRLSARAMRSKASRSSGKSAWPSSVSRRLFGKRRNSFTPRRCSRVFT